MTKRSQWRAVKAHARGHRGCAVSRVPFGATGQARRDFRPRCQCCCHRCCCPWGLRSRTGGCSAAAGMAHARAQLLAATSWLLLLGPWPHDLSTAHFYGAMRWRGDQSVPSITSAPRPCLAAPLNNVMEPIQAEPCAGPSVRLFAALCGDVLICLAEGSSHACGRFICPAWGLRLVCLGGFTYALFIAGRRGRICVGVRSFGRHGATFGLGGVCSCPC